MSKPENSFIAGVHKYVECYAEKNNNPYRGGTFDVFYSGTLAPLWVEYKFIRELPKRGTTVIIPELSRLQIDWGQGRLAENRDVHVVIGCKEGAVILRPDEWETGMTTDEFRMRVITRKELARWIDQRAGPPPTAGH